MNKVHWTSMGTILALLLLASGCLPEARARIEVTKLVKIAVPPESACMSEPQVWGAGNNPKYCVGHAVTCIVGSSLTREKIQEYYTQRLGAGWTRFDVDQSGAIQWFNQGDLLDRMIVISYEPKYLPVDSQAGRELQGARQTRTSAYELTVVANKCTGPFP